MTPRWDVLGLGSIAVDDLIYVDRFPTEDTKMMVQPRQRKAGGQAATALVAAARLGAKSAYFGVLGDDELSQFVVKSLKKRGRGLFNDHCSNRGKTYPCGRDCGS